MDWGPAIRPTRAEIDLRSVISNARALAARAACPLLAVVKADAYGHGATPVARALESSGAVHGFAVSLVEEGVELRLAGITLPILVMGPSLVDAYQVLLEHRLTPMVSDARHLEPLSDAASAASLVLDLHLKFDTGMSRLGLPLEHAEKVLERISKQPALRVVGVASHLACADLDAQDDPLSMTATQLARFASLASQCRSKLGPQLRLHLANSAGILRFPESSYDLARPGIALYGNGIDSSTLNQALRLVSEVTQIRELQVGDCVSYGALWTASRATRAAIVPVGYADGLPRNLSGVASILVHGRRCPIIGTVSMDMIVADVTDVHCAVGDETVLIGSQGNEKISVAEIARHAGISEYEVSCGISKRVPRIYSNS